MARNKYPEKTVEKILSVSLRLFNEKGYEKTTIQDIVNELGMSKGAIYHHFKSKEEIVDAISRNCYHNNQDISNILHDASQTGLQKLQAILMAQMNDDLKKEVDVLSLDMWKNPKIFMMGMKENLDVNARLVEGLLEEGNRDGSIHTSNPRFTSQVLMLLMNYWILSPMITDNDPEIICDKIRYLRDLSASIGVNIIDDSIEDTLTAYFRQLSANS